MAKHKKKQAERSPDELDALLNQFLEETDPQDAQETESIEDLNEKLEELLADSDAKEPAQKPKPQLEPAPAPEPAPVPEPIPVPESTQDPPPEEPELENIIEEVHASDWQDEELLAEDDPENEEASADQEDVPVQKRIPKNERSYGLFGISHIASTIIWLILVAAIGAAIGNALWLAASDVLAFGREDVKVTITISPNDDMNAIADKLQEMGLIKYPALFKLYVQITDDVPVPGTYELNTLFDYHALVKKMRPAGGARVTVDVMIPEGYTCQQIFQLMEDKGVCSVADLEEAAVSADLGSYWFLEGVERTDKYCLEGYLFPDTYEFYMADDADRVLKKLLNNFNKRFTETMSDKLIALNIMLAEKMQANGLSQDYIDKHQITIREIVIIASLIERESSKQTEIYKISSVIYNRLTDPENYPTLDIDATLIYLTGRNEITEADKLIDSPYNSYIQKGLIPGAICNPGRTSINAALDPEDTDFHFYALDPSTGEHNFSVTYKEHQAFLDSIKDKKED